MGSFIGGGTYTVKAGDNLNAIAREIYGDERFIKNIIHRNRLQSDVIRPGMVLKMPALRKGFTPVITNQEAMAYGMNPTWALEGSEAKKPDNWSLPLPDGYVDKPYQPSPEDSPTGFLPPENISAPGSIDFDAAIAKIFNTKLQKSSGETSGQPAAINAYNANWSDIDTSTAFPSVNQGGRVQQAADKAMAPVRAEEAERSPYQYEVPGGPSIVEMPLQLSGLPSRDYQSLAERVRPQVYVQMIEELAAVGQKPDIVPGLLVFSGWLRSPDGKKQVTDQQMRQSGYEYFPTINAYMYTGNTGAQFAMPDYQAPGGETPGFAAGQTGGNFYINPLKVMERGYAPQDLYWDRSRVGSKGGGGGGSGGPGSRGYYDRAVGRMTSWRGFGYG